jgi:hypothetical protein
MLCAASTCRAYLRDRSDVLDDADFVVDVHDGDQHRIGPKCRGDLSGVEQSAASGLKVRHLPPAAFEFAARIEHRLVFRACRDDVPARFALVIGHAEQRDVVRLGRSGRPHDVGGRCPDGCGHLHPRRLHQSACRLSVIVARRTWIAKRTLLREAFGHARGDPRIHRRGGRVVEVHGVARPGH